MPAAMAGDGTGRGGEKSPGRRRSGAEAQPALGRARLRGWSPAAAREPSREQPGRGCRALCGKGGKNTSGFFRKDPRAQPSPAPGCHGGSPAAAAPGRYRAAHPPRPPPRPRTIPRLPFVCSSGAGPWGRSPPGQRVTSGRGPCGDSARPDRGCRARAARGRAGPGRGGPAALASSPSGAEGWREQSPSSRAAPAASCRPPAALPRGALGAESGGRHLPGTSTSTVPHHRTEPQRHPRAAAGPRCPPPQLCRGAGAMIPLSPSRRLSPLPVPALRGSTDPCGLRRLRSRGRQERVLSLRSTEKRFRRHHR